MASSSSSSPSVPFGRAMRRAHFLFSADYTPLNHGSYGTYPASVRDVHAALQSEVEAAPDRFIVLDWPARLRESRALAAGLLKCSTEDLVFVPNATTGVDTVLKNLAWRPGDVVLVYEVVYDSVRAGLAWLEEVFGVKVEVVPLAFPAADDDLVDAAVSAARRINGRPGERVRLAVVDTIVSVPGLRLPFERLVPRLQAEGALVLVDGAHGIGHIDIDLGKLDPDFFVSNLHKWLFVPRGCAALVVPKRNQGLIRTSLPTSYRFRRRELAEGEGGNGKWDDTNAFVMLFDFTAALDFRSQVCGGEEAIRAYCQSVARQGAEAAAAVLGTEIMDCAGSCARECNFANVRLPLELADDASSAGEGKINPKHGAKVGLWFKAMGVKENGTYCQIFVYRSAFWWRISGMIYVEADDFRKGAEMLKGLCERAKKGEYLTNVDMS